MATTPPESPWDAGSSTDRELRQPLLSTPRREPHSAPPAPPDAGNAEPAEAGYGSGGVHRESRWRRAATPNAGHAQQPQVAPSGAVATRSERLSGAVGTSMATASLTNTLSRMRHVQEHGSRWDPIRLAVGYYGYSTGDRDVFRKYGGDWTDTASVLTLPITEVLQPRPVKEDFFEPAVRKRARWISIYVMYLTMFLSSIGFSIVLQTLSPYLNSIGGDGTAFLGYVVAAYSVGQLIGSPIFGWWSNVRKCKEPLIVSIIINFAGNVMYCFCAAIPTNGQWFMLAARTLVGLGAGNVAVCRSYVSGATNMAERTSAMANMSACQGVGFIIGPLLGSAFAPLNPTEGSVFQFNRYTGPGWLSAVFGLINIVLLILYFTEYRVEMPMSSAAAAAGGQIQTDVDLSVFVKTYDGVAATEAIFTFFVTLFMFAVFETIGTPLTQAEYGWSSEQADVNCGIIFGVAGAVAVVVFIACRFLAARFGERPLLVVGMLIVLGGFVLYLPWGPGYVTCKHCYQEPYLPFPQFIAGCTLIAIGYPMCSVMIYTIFSKILGPSPQGLGMGMLTAAGSLARTLGPIFVGNMYDSFGLRVTFSSICGMIVLTFGSILFFYQRFIPHIMWR